MRAEQRRYAAAPEHGFDDAQRGGRWRNGSGRYALVVGSQLLQRADEAIRLAHHTCAGLVGGVFPRARKKELQHQGRKWREEDHQQGREAAHLAVIVAVSTETTKDHGPATHGRKIGDGACNRCGDGTGEDVVVSDVRKLVGDYSFKFYLVHQFKQAFGYLY